MFQVRIHGRGGQGVVTAAELLAVDAFEEGRPAQAFPSFGSERTGAPVVSFCRIDDHPIRTREPVMSPDAVLIQDVTLLHQIDVFAGIAPEGYALVNSSRSLEDLGLTGLVASLPAGHVATCPATDLALEHVGRPLPNAALLGGFAALTRAITLDALVNAIGERFAGAVGERNADAARAAFDYVHAEQERLTSAATD